MSEEFLSLFITVRDGMYYFRAREIFKNLGYEYRQRERGFNDTGADAEGVRWQNEKH